MRVNCPGCDTRVRYTDDEQDLRIKCPECGEKFRPSDVEDEPPTRSRPSRSSGKRRVPVRKQASNVPMMVAIGMVITVVGVGGLIAGAVMLMNAGPATAKTTPRSEPPTEGGRPDNFDRPFGQPPETPGTAPTPSPGTGGINPFPPNPGTGGPRPNPSFPPAQPMPEPRRLSELEALFRDPIDKEPPVARIPMLVGNDRDGPLDVPTFHSLLVANKMAKPPLQSKLTLDQVKQATVFIQVDAGELSGSGSGFFIGSENGSALVATNHHVIEAAIVRKDASGPKPTVSCVFNSGLPDEEVASEAKIIAFDPIADLAVLRLTDPPAKMPKPINPWATPKLTETMEVRICGFPFGDQLATATKNPNISVTSGTVSSLRLSKSGGLDRVQIDGSINPGNSGGPIVDKDGRLVGLAVTTIKGSGLGFAVPANDLIALLEGRILLTEFIPISRDQQGARFRVVIPVMDPRNQVKTVYVRYWAGLGAKPRGIRDARMGWRPIEGAEQLNMQLPESGSSLSVATGVLKLPAHATDVVVQIASENAAGLVAASAPVEYKLVEEDLPTGTDARPMSELVRNPAALAGQTLVVRGKVVSPPKGVGPHEELQVSDSDGSIPDSVRFLAAPEVSVQFDEVDPDHQENDVRLVCVVGRRGDDGRISVRVVRCDFLDEGDVVVRSIPEAETKDPLAAVNRDPKNFSDKTITFEAVAMPFPVKARGADEFIVFFESLARPRNLSFALASGLVRKVSDAKFKPNGLYDVRLTARVEAKPSTGATLTVTKIEVLDPSSGSVQIALE